VYLGTDEAVVADANRSNHPNVDYENVDVNSYDPDLELGKTYYWRVDEVNSSDVPQWPGWVWSFAVSDVNAWNPSPADGDQYVALDAELSWSPGAYATSHDVYFGTSSPPPFIQNQGPNSYDPPGDLTAGQTYYWRIREHGAPGGPYMGDIWSFRATTGLRGWWKFDDGDGNTPADSSGNNNHAIFGVSPNSMPTWTSSGRIDGALEFDGDEDWVDVVHDPNFDITKSITVTAWIKINNFGGEWQSMIGKPTCWKFERSGSSGNILWTVEGGDPYNCWGSVFVDDGEWHHLAGVYDGTTGQQYLYVDGQLDASASDAPHSIPTSTNPIYIGSNGLACVIDDLRIYDYNLTEDEIWNLYDVPWLTAHDPIPGNKSTVETALDGMLTLSWIPGDYADSHDVYFGADFNDVNTGNPSVFKGNQALDANSYDTDTLDLDRTYYWRIDEVNDPCLWEGDVWSFTTAIWVPVDDFERYNKTAEPYISNTWQALGDALVYLEDEMANSGLQSMDLNYYAGYYTYGEVCRTYDSPQDWTVRGIKALTLWFRGEATNQDERLYVALEDSTGKRAEVEYPSPDLQSEAWQEWDIELQLFNDIDDVNLASIKKICIGLGGTEPLTSAGHVYIDDIRLYPPRCIPEYVAASFNNDCIVDCEDLDIMTYNWLVSDYNVIAEAPSDANLVARYEFEGDFNDSSGNGHHGDPNGDATTVYNAARDSNVLELDGDGDFVSIVDSNTPAGPFDITGTITIAAWIKVDTFDKDWQAIVTKGDSAWRLARAGSGDGVEFACNGLWPYQWVSGDVKVNDGQWHHAAGVYDGSQLRIYVDGVLDFFENTGGNINSNDSNVYIGENAQETGREWNGLIDEVRIYSRALSQAEIVSLAGEAQIYQPLQPLLSTSANLDLYEDGKVNFKDYAIFADSWLDGPVLWP
jgi:hypothetical protein